MDKGYNWHLYKYLVWLIKLYCTSFCLAPEASRDVQVILLDLKLEMGKSVPCSDRDVQRTSIHYNIVLREKDSYHSFEICVKQAFSFFLIKFNWDFL